MRRLSPLFTTTRKSHAMEDEVENGLGEMALCVHFFLPPYTHVSAAQQHLPGFLPTSKEVNEVTRVYIAKFLYTGPEGSTVMNNPEKFMATVDSVVKGFPTEQRNDVWLSEIKTELMSF